MLAAVIAASAAAPVAAQTRRAAADTATRVDPRSPRAAVAEFLNLTRRGQFEAAGKFLPNGSDDRATDLARRLKAVLDQRLFIQLDDVSPLAVGDTTDGMRDRDQLGTVPNELGVPQPVQIERRAPGSEVAWAFTSQTVSRIDGWYNALGEHWVRDHMPATLLQPGPFGIDRWQWLMLALLLPVAFVLGYVGDRVTGALLRRAVRHTQTDLDDRILERVRHQLRALWMVITYRGLVEFVSLSIGAERLVGTIVRALSALIVTWMAWRATYVLEEELPKTSATMGTTGMTPIATPTAAAAQARVFAPLIGRVMRIFLVAFGAILIVSQFGYSVTALLTGVGIGGIALALAAQKTLEHTFGSVAIGLDQPIRVGDWVKVGDTEGEVESIGLRSTRLRTIERTIVVLPNGRLADMQMENYGVRDRILLKTKLGLRYDTKREQLLRIRGEIERVLTEHPLVWPGRIIVRFGAFGASSLDVDVIAWLTTTDYNVFRAAREEIYLKFLEIIERAGCSFAYPTQTIQLEQPEKRDRRV